MKNLFILFLTITNILFVYGNIQSGKTEIISENRQALSSLDLRQKVENAHLLDSVIGYDANGTYTNKEEYTYDNHGNKRSNSFYEWDLESAKWKGIQKHEFRYDNSTDSLIEETSYRWNVDAARWIAEKKSTYEYDDNGKKTLEILYEWINGSWIEDYKAETVYDKYENITSYISWSWNATNNEWVGVFKRITEYDEVGKYIILWEEYYWNPVKELWEGQKKEKTKDKITTIYRWEGDRNIWIETSKVENIYNDKNLVLSSIYQIIENNLWINYQKREYAYDDRGNQTSSKSFDWDSQKNTWIDRYKLEMTFDKNGNTLTYEDYRWNAGKQLWEGYIAKSEQQYNEAGDEIYYLKHKWDYSTDQWVLDIKTESTFNKNETQKITFSWRDGAWIEYSKSEYKYDDSKNQILFAEYDWDISKKQWMCKNMSESKYDEYGDKTLHISYSYENGELISYYTTSYYYSLKGSSLESEKQSNLQIYPNPVADSFYVDGLKNDSSLLELFDLSGKVVFCKKISRNDFIDITNLPKGIYLVKIQTEGITIEQKIIKQ